MPTRAMGPCRTQCRKDLFIKTQWSVVKGCTEYGNDTFVHSIAPIGKVIAKVEDEGPGVIFRVLEHQGLPSQADGHLHEKELIFKKRNFQNTFDG